MKERLINTKKRFAKKIIVKNKPIIIGLLFIIILGVVVVPSIFATLQPIKSIEILSSDPSYYSKEDGAWKVTNSAEFISSDTALVTMDLDTIAKGSSNYKDVIFLIDTSETMNDEKFNTLKRGVVAAIENILKDTNNKVGIVSFNSSSTIVSSLSNSKSDLINRVNSLTKGTGTSYYQALIKLDNILKNYENDENRELKVIFITDGIPSKDSPNEVGQYQYLKDKYSYLKIDGVQYEAGDKIFTELESVSDKSYLTNKDNFSNILGNSVISNNYESFTIKEKLNSSNFLVESINDIKVSSGSIKLENNIVTWNLENISTGSKGKMTLKAKLKNTSNGLYELNNNIEVSSAIGGVNDAVTSTNTPVLSNNYKVKYDGNKPSDCTLSGVPSDTTHKVFETVGIASAPKCSGYQFKGWDIINDNVTKVNEDYFIMPEEDVTLKANWSKLNIRKSTDGTVSQGLTLYGQVLSDSKNSTKYAKKYTGDTSTFTGNNDVYYYYGAASNNNVIFANYCWKIVRTTDTGGVKLLYNGVPSNGACNNTGDASTLTAEEMGTSSNKVAFNTNYTSPADVGYMYNTRYERRNKDMSEIQSVSNDESITWDFTHQNSFNSSFSSGSLYSKQSSFYVPYYNDVDGSSFTSSSITPGKYICFDPYMDRSCNTLYYYLGYINSKTAKVISKDFSFKISSSINDNKDGTYTLIDPVTFEFDDFSKWVNGYNNYKSYYICEDKSSTTCSKAYKITNTSISTIEYTPVKNKNLSLKPSSVAGFYSGTDYEYENSVGQYYPSGSTDSSQDLLNKSPEFYIGKYLCPSYLNDHCNPIYYVLSYSGTSSSYGTFTVLSSDSFPLKVASSLTKNSNNTYTLNSPVTLDLKKWVNGYQYYENYYMCEDSSSTTCSKVYKIIDTSISNISYASIAGNSYKFGNNFTYNNGNYTLTNTKSVSNWSNDYGSLNNYHYTCFNVSGVCSTLYYVYYGNSSNAYYINLNKGKSVDDALNEMLYNSDVNKNNSTIKKAIDYWYKNNMTDYTSYLEDTVWCNDRSMANQSSNGWNPSGGSLSTYLYFNSYSNSSNLICKNAIDRFTVNSSNGNGALTYPVGLITRQEQSLAYSSSKSPLAKGTYYRGLSPNHFHIGDAYGFNVGPSGDWYNSVVVGTYGVSPAVSLRTGIEYRSGDGSSSQPYVIATTDSFS